MQPNKYEILNELQTNLMFCPDFNYDRNITRIFFIIFLHKYITLTFYRHLIMQGQT